MSNRRSPFFGLILAVVILLVIGSCGLLGFTTCNPPDRVGVTFSNVPSEMHFVALAAQTKNGPVGMGSFVTSIGLPYELPANYGVAAPPYSLGGHVRWRFGDKYGVLMQTQKGEWKVAWFPAADVPLNGRTVLGGGKAEFDLSKAEIVPLDPKTVKELGLQDVKPYPP